MLRISLFAAAALLAGVACAQTNADPQSAAPVVYSGAGLNDSGCDSDVRNADGSPVMSCVADRQPQDDEYIDYDSGAYEPAYYAPDYYASDDAYAPDFYLGVSLLPYNYWSLGFGWPYYGYATFGYGWPYFGFASYWGGGYWGGHHGWHDRHGHHGHDYHGPYRYAGHGRYWDQTRQASNHGDHHDGYGHRPVAGAAFNTPAARNRPTDVGAAPGNRSLGAPANGSRLAPAANMPISARTGQRAVLRSASYYAAAQSNMRARAMPITSASPIARSNLGNSRSASQAYRVTSLPNRSYNAAGRVASGYRQTYSGAARSSYRQSYSPAPRSGYSVPHGRYATAPRSGYSMPPQRYSMPARGYSVQRSAPSYGRGGAGSATHSAGASSARSSVSSHVGSSGFSRAH